MSRSEESIGGAAKPYQQVVLKLLYAKPAGTVWFDNIHLVAGP